MALLERGCLGQGVFRAHFWREGYTPVKNKRIVYSLRLTHTNTEGPGFAWGSRKVPREARPEPAGTTLGGAGRGGAGRRRGGEAERMTERTLVSC